jgi:hypothetical protein
MNDENLEGAPGAAASIVSSVLTYAASPWQFAGLVLLAVLTFGGVMTYVEREAIATYVLKSLKSPKLDMKNGQKVLTRVVRESRAKFGILWSVDLHNNLQTVVNTTDFSGENLKSIDIGYTWPIISVGSNIKIAAALMNGQSICFDPADSNEVPHQTMSKDGVKWICATSIPNGLGAWVGLMHIMWIDKPDQYVEQAALRALAEASSELTIR